MTMSQALTKPAWPEATTCVTAAGWKYHSTIPLPALYFGMTKRPFSGRARNHKASIATHIMALHFLATAALTPPASVKAWDQTHPLRFIKFHCALATFPFHPSSPTSCTVLPVPSSFALTPCISLSLSRYRSSGEHMHFLYKTQWYSDSSAVWKWHLAGKCGHAANALALRRSSFWLIYPLPEIVW